MCSSTGSLLQNSFTYIHILFSTISACCYKHILPHGKPLFLQEPVGQDDTSVCSNIRWNGKTKQNKKKTCRARFDIMSLFWTSIKAWCTYVATCRTVYLLFISLLCLVFYITIKASGTHLCLKWKRWLNGEPGKNTPVLICPPPSCENDETPKPLGC